MLSVTSLSAWYGGAQALFDVAFTIGAGEALALLGSNGAGKSTTCRAVAGQLVRRAGRIDFDGEDVTRLPPYALALRGLAYVPEDRRIFSDLSVEENLLVGRQPPRRGAPHWTEARLFALFPDLAPLRRRRGGVLSGGEQQMLTIARALMGQPRLVLLDEPAEGLAPRVVDILAKALAELKREGVALLVAEQSTGFARAVADRAVVIARGRIVFEGSLAEAEARRTV